MGEEEMRLPGCNFVSLKFRVFTLLLSLAALLISGCGYTWKSTIREKYKTIYITPFTNKTDITQETYSANRHRIYRPTIETDITRSVINKFLSDGNLKLVDEGSADLVLKGDLVDYRRDVLRYDKNDEVLEYRINLVVNISLFDKINNTMLWEENNFTGDTTYLTQGNNSKSEDTAVADALKDLARRIVERTVEMW
jgi:outer membrane lipopolysaccharide assembly protein LptE/RlpB